MISASYYLANWKPLTEIVRKGGGPEAIWSVLGNEEYLVEIKVSDWHGLYSVGQVAAEIYQGILPFIDDEDEADVLDELFSAFGVIGGGSDDLSRIDDYEPKPLPPSHIGVATFSICPMTVAFLENTCFDFDASSLLAPYDKYLESGGEIDERISTFEEFIEFIEGLISMVRRAQRWSAGIVIWAG